MLQYKEGEKPLKKRKGNVIMNGTALNFHYDFLTSLVLTDPEFFTKKVPYMKAAGVRTVWLDNYIYGEWQNTPEEASRAKAMLEAEGFEVTTGDYLDRYAARIQAEEDAYYRGIRSRCGESIMDGVIDMYSRPFVPSAQLPVTEADIAASGADTAVYVISRVSGEGAHDRRQDRYGRRGYARGAQ